MTQTTAPTNDRWIRALLIVLGIVACYRSVALVGDDFAEFYMGGKLAASKLLYDYHAVHELEQQYHTGDFTLPFLRLPVEAWLFKPLALLPYTAARIVYLIIAIIASIVFVIRSPGNSLPDRALLGAWFLPISCCAVVGQDTIFFALLAVIAAHRLEAGDTLKGGLLIGLCLFKFHLGIGLFVVLISKRWWTAVGGAALSSAALVGVSSALRQHWVSEFVAELSVPGAEGAIGRMMTVRGLASYIPLPTLTEIFISATLLVLTWIVCRWMPVRDSIALGLTIGVLVGRHAYLYDLVLLFPLLSLSWAHGTRLLLLALLCPPFYFLGRTPRAIQNVAIATDLILITVVVEFIFRGLRLSPRRKRQEETPIHEDSHG